MQEKNTWLKAKKRSYFLLEILVSMALFALVIVPLLTMNWSILLGEIEGQKEFEKELEVKRHAISKVEALYRGTYSAKVVAEGVSLNFSNGHMRLADNNTIILSYTLSKGVSREFPLRYIKKKTM